MKEQNGRESLRRLKFILGCNASKRRRMPLGYSVYRQSVSNASRLLSIQTVSQ